MKSIDRRFDAIVIGSGAGGSIAVKELTERGMDVLLLEAGRDLTEADFVPPPRKPPRQLGMDLHLRAKAALAGQHVQARRTFFSETSNRFLVNDRQNPYSTPQGAPYLWIRGRILGGRLHSYGRDAAADVGPRLQSGEQDGPGEDWPISYARPRALVRPGRGVRRRLRQRGRDRTARRTASSSGPAKLSDVEQDFKEKVEERWPDRKVISWRYAAPNLGRVPRGIAAARETGRLTTRTDAVVSGSPSTTARASRRRGVRRPVTKREHRVYADVVLLCASTIESLRLMLNSGSAKHPPASATPPGCSGRYFMDQTASLTFGAVPEHPGYWGFGTTRRRPTRSTRPPAAS